MSDKDIGVLTERLDNLLEIVRECRAEIRALTDTKVDVGVLKTRMNIVYAIGALFGGTVGSVVVKVFF